MYRNQSIKIIAGWVMFLLFAINITPRQLLHDIITGHKHKYDKVEAGVSLQTPKNNFQCNCHELAVESPFIEQPDLLVPQPVIAFSSYIDHYIHDHYSTAHFFSSLRGPPSIV